ncbi:hypothetical protein Tco_1521274, partial [Tanacetum coccineum]
HLEARPDKGLQHLAKPDTNFVLTSGAIRGTRTQPRFSKKLTMSTHEQQTTNNPTSFVRNTRRRNDPQSLEEPMSDEVVRRGSQGNVRQKLSPTLAAHRREDAKIKRAERQTQRSESTTDLRRRVRN